MESQSEKSVKLSGKNDCAYYGFCCIRIVTQMIAGAVHLMGSKKR